MKSESKTICIVIALCVLASIVPACSATYDFEGIPFSVVATGEVNGDVLAYGTYGLRDPPVSLDFDIPSEIVWARTYVGVWGGTPRYTGWVSLTVNNGSSFRTDLFGSDDKNKNVYVTGYGVYWVTYDTTNMLRKGPNTITATTSRTEENNKLDGRIYTVVTLVVVKDPLGDTTRYWIAEGNEDLHGEGWSGLNPTVHENATVTIPGVDTSGVTSANLTLLYLTSGKGQPDYTRLNGNDLGNIVTDTAQYPAGARDIADETSFNAGYVSPIDSRYVDMEVFDVRKLIRSGNNVLLFERGRDLDGDGQIIASGEKPEGEDYLHPVLAMLALKKPRAVASTPDLMAEQVTISDAFAGGNATVTATIKNLGSATADPATVFFTVDGAAIANVEIPVEKSGIQKVSCTWTATAGTHTVAAEVRHTGDANSANNIARQEVMVGALPDLAASIGDPVREGGDDSTEQSPAGGGIAICAVVTGIFILFRRKPRHPVAALVFAVMIVLAAGVTVLPVTVSADDPVRSYTLPVTVKNLGGSDAGPFTISVYLDGEKVTIKDVTSGLAAGKELVAEIPVHTNPATHEIRVVIDEGGKVKDANLANNSATATLRFP